MAGEPGYSIQVMTGPCSTAISIAGELDLTVSRDLMAALARVPVAQPVTMDLAGVTFCDSAAFLTLRAACLMLNLTGQLRVTRVSGPVQKIADLLGEGLPGTAARRLPAV